MNLKTYNLKNLKFPLMLIFLLIFSVILLYYLLSLKTFLPFNDSNEYQWINILVASGLFFTTVFSISSLVSYLILKTVLRKEDCRDLKIICLRWGIFFSFGLFLVFVLNFFHVLNIYWGLGILLVVIISSFVI